MASLTDVYDGHVGGHASLQRLNFGIALFLTGSALVIVAIVLASTEILSAFGVGRFQTRRIAGVFAGLGIPSVFIGIFAVMPATKRVRAAAVIGASVAVLGVALFWSVYPSQWLGAGVDRHYTFEVATVYFIGTIVTFWCLFVGIANFKTRNDPGGTVKLEITKEGKTRIVEMDRTALGSGLGGIGILGGRPDGSVSTQTNRPSATVSDGGGLETDLRTPIGSRSDPQNHRDGEILNDESSPAWGPVDTYCGNCKYFEYVRTNTGIQPYCGFHREEMTDMDACDEWTPNKL